jgi:hypothetical protein
VNIEEAESRHDECPQDKVGEETKADGTASLANCCWKVQTFMH